MQPVKSPWPCPSVAGLLLLSSCYILYSCWRMIHWRYRPFWLNFLLVQLALAQRDQRLLQVDARLGLVALRKVVRTVDVRAVQ